MRFLYMKEDVGYEEFLAAVYEAETEGLDGKMLNVKAKAMTVEKITDNKEQNYLKDLRQQIESLTMIMKSATIKNMKSKAVEGISSPRKKEVLKNSPKKGFQGSPKRGKDLWNWDKNLSSVTDVMVGVMGGWNVQLWKT